MQYIRILQLVCVRDALANGHYSKATRSYYLAHQVNITIITLYGNNEFSGMGELLLYMPRRSVSSYVYISSIHCKIFNVLVQNTKDLVLGKHGRDF
jgi:hypothetical protein